MEQTIRQMIKHIIDGKNLEEYLPRYADNLAGHYNQIAILNLAMNYYTLYEQIIDGSEEETNLIMDSFDKVNHCIGLVFGQRSETDVKAAEAGILEERNRVIKKMQVLTAYTDRFQNYEYVLNRMELNYGPFEQGDDDDGFTQMVAQYIFDTKDAPVINGRLKEVLGQLPVRMARSRYFDLVKESLSVYKGTDQSALDTFDYMFRSCAMLYEPEGMGIYFKKYGELSDKLETLDYENLDEQQYQELTDSLTETAQSLSEVTDLYVSLQEVINNLYACILSSTANKVEAGEEVRVCREIIADVYAEIVREETDEPAADILSKFFMIEGKQEELQLTRQLLETALEEVKADYLEKAEELGLLNQFRNLFRMNQLLGNSLFIEFKPENEETADEESVKKTAAALVADLEQSFKKRPRPVNRAVIANTINKMPVFFHSAGEVAEYIKCTLEQCRNEGEKQVSKNLIQDIIMEDMDIEL